MKNKITVALSVATIFASAVTFSLLGGCSGGGGGSNANAGPIVIPSTLTTESIPKLARNVLDVGSCEAVSGIAQTSTLNTTLDSNNNDSEGIKSYNMQTTDSHPIDETVNGPLGGTLHKHGQHLNGTTSLTYDYTNFTVPFGDSNFTVNGSASVIDNGKPGDYGPILTNKTIDTKGAFNIAEANTSTLSSTIATSNNTTNYVAQLTGYVQTYATVLASPDALNIQSGSLKNENTNKKYTIDNLSAKAYFSDDQINLSDAKTSFTDPDIGTLQVTSDSVIIERDSVKLPSSVATTLTLTATDGTKAQADITENGSVKIYSIEDSGAKTLVSELNCSALIH